MVAYLHQCSGPSSQPPRCITFSQSPPVSAMEARSQSPKGRDGTISSLNAAIDVMNLAREVSSITPAKAVFGSVSVLLTMIKVRPLP